MRHRFSNHLQIVEMQNLVHADAVLAQKPIHVSLDRQIFVANELEPVQLGRLNRSSPA